MRVRLAEPADLPLLGPIEVRAGERFRSIGMADVAEDPPFPLEVLEACQADGCVWVAELSGEVVGYALALETGGLAHLEQVSVVPEAGGMGVGAALVDAVGHWAEGRAPWLTLSTFTGVPWNQPWYERIGFTVVPADEVGPALHEIVEHEVALGLDVSQRAFLRRRAGWVAGDSALVAGLEAEE